MQRANGELDYIWPHLILIVYYSFPLFFPHAECKHLWNNDYTQNTLSITLTCDKSQIQEIVHCNFSPHSDSLSKKRANKQIWLAPEQQTLVDFWEARVSDSHNYTAVSCRRALQSHVHISCQIRAFICNDGQKGRTNPFMEAAIRNIR